MPGRVPSSPLDAAIARVRSSLLGKPFRWFPNHQAHTGCRMGTCQARVTLNDNSRTAIVTFTETWLTLYFSTPGPYPGPISHHSWRFAVKRDPRTGPWRSVVALGGYGDFPPQGLHPKR